MPFSFVAPDGRVPHNLFDDRDFASQRAFFTRRPHLAATPLHDCPGLAAVVGVDTMLVKDETSRFGLNAFKAVGAMFAVGTLVEQGRISAGDTLVCASEGNHGRAVARAARDAGCSACVYVSDTVAGTRVAAIESEGATVVPVQGTYDEAVKTMASDAATRGWTIISDTSWAGYEEVPRLIMLGYTRLFDEAEQAWLPGRPPDAMFVPGGVGGLLAAAACWCEWRYGAARPSVVGVEPTAAACLQLSARQGRPTAVSGPFDTVMGGLRCGEVSPLAFGATHTLVDRYVAVEDTLAFEAMRLLARPRGDDPVIQCGPSGAAALAGVLALPRDYKRVMVLVTEGMTDPALFGRALGC
ncbi:MAG: pyridoxal-phosphate dependent enzyme [Acidobacteria bacterium]|nr:pyridoxal-phosphate dependent enzyme [Acidobacteriota bacterium]